MLLPYERVQRVNKNTPGHTIVYLTQLWDFCTDFNSESILMEYSTTLVITWDVHKPEMVGKTKLFFKSELYMY